MNAFQTLLDIASGRSPASALAKHWPGYETSAAAFEARLRRSRAAPQAATAASKHYLVPVRRDEMRADKTYLVIESGASFFVSALKSGREAARALASRAVAVYDIANR